MGAACYTEKVNTGTGGGIMMENVTLISLVESDKEALMGALAANRSPEAAQAALERTLDRALMRWAEACEACEACETCEACDVDEVRQAGQLIVSALKSALPLIDSVGEARQWRSETASPARPGLRPMTLGLLAVSGVLTLSTLLGLTLASGRLTSPMTLIGSLLPAAAGVGAAYWAGLTAGRPEKNRDDGAAARQEFLVDPEKLWRNLRGMLLLADDALERIRSEAVQPKHSEAEAAGNLSGRDVELFSNLLESAYAQDNSDAREMIEAIRFYLHGAGVELIDFAPGQENCFELLPASQPGTLRPALMSGDRVVKRGLAAR